MSKEDRQIPLAFSANIERIMHYQTLTVAKIPLCPDACLPTRKHPEDAGLDVYAYGNTTVWPFSSKVLRTGITIEIPRGYVLQAWPKGKSEHLVGAGIIDAGYQGEILVKIFNPTWKPVRLGHGDALAQLVLIPVETPAPVEVGSNDIHKEQSARGATGGIHGDM
jgi:dUTP pyrophosphatase